MTDTADCATRLKVTVNELAKSMTDRTFIVEALVKVIITTAEEEPEYEIVYLTNVAAALRQAIFRDEQETRYKIKTGEHEIAACPYPPTH